jgi:predicted permease
LGIPDSVELSINTRVLVFTLAAAVVSALIFGCFSVMHTVGNDALGALREASRGTTASVRTARMRSGFVVVQVALSVVLLIGAGLFLRTLQNAYAVDLGYGIERTLLAEINLDLRGYAPEPGQAVHARVLDAIRAIPGVDAAGAARVIMLSGNARTTGLSTDGQPLARDGSNSIGARTNVVSDGYLDAMGIPLVRGRDFRPADSAGSPRVAIVSRSLAERLWPGSDPIGQTLISEGPPFEVVGVIPDVVYLTPLEGDSPGFFLSSLSQNYEAGMTLHVRTVVDPLEVFPTIRQAVRSVDPLLALSTPLRLSEVLARSLGEQRMMARLVVVFGALAFILAVTGLYGVLAHLVLQRRAEIGVRLALGAPPRSVFALIVGQGLKLVVIGLPLGIAGALTATRYVRSQLFGVEPSDPLTFAAVCAIFIAIAVAACAIPARRAIAIDPTIALRQI